MRSALFLLASSLMSSLDPGCGVGVGQTPAQNDGGAPPPNEAVSQIDCGSLGKHTFCEDFGEAKLPGAFDANEELSAGTLALDTSRFVTAPPSLVATTLAVTNAPETRARLRKNFTETGRGFVLGFSEWVDPTCLGSNDLVQTGSIVLESGTYGLGIAHGAGGDSVLEVKIGSYSTLEAHALASPLPRAAWTRVVLSVDLDTSTMALEVDGDTVMSGEHLTVPPSGAQQPGIQVGTQTDNITFAPHGCTVHIDDVTFDIDP